MGSRVLGQIPGKWIALSRKRSFPNTTWEPDFFGDGFVLWPWDNELWTCSNGA
jgi:hypothetical protein